MMLITHILAGFIGLFVAPGAMLTRKGSTWHRRWGWIYAGSMLAVGGTAIALALSPLNLFLLLVGVFSMYMAYSGVRFIRQRRLRSIHLVDWVIASITALASVVLAAYGGLELLDGRSFGWVAIVFGALGAGLAGSDLNFYRRPDFSPAAIYTRHLRMMLASYIAMVSAFSAVNLLFLPPVVRWLWPTIVGSVLIAMWSRRVARRFAPRKQKAAPDAILSSPAARHSLRSDASHD